jgi:hypothetical protein
MERGVLGTSQQRMCTKSLHGPMRKQGLNGPLTQARFTRISRGAPARDPADALAKSRGPPRWCPGLLRVSTPYSGCMPQRFVWFVLIALALGATEGAQAGGSFERIVGVGANGNSAVIKLEQTGPHSDSMLNGRPVPVPKGGYVRLYPFIGDLPAIPGRLYPASNVLCLYWHEPASNCLRLSSGGSRLLAPLASLPLRRSAPTVPIEVRYRSHVLRYAGGNIFAALEMAFERRSHAVPSAPAEAVALTVTWRGPAARERPRGIMLTPLGAYAHGRLSPLPRGVWCYLVGNLPANFAPASKIKAAANIRCG